ncbi:hypothetical protein FOMPIDRAFT_1049432 [Fomitopsis schrenkii]|uniref:Uncharacterized protein n=1 Tax=Fomitopsis schrenkii TaxID=2126942 RepID=S8E7J2_FOMSC|nr:hypothetical protein FOMPIDRAFT_1049432 [Fomitopsis schrenkii]
MSIVNHCRGVPVEEREGTATFPDRVGGDNDCLMYNHVPPLLSCTDADNILGNATEVKANGHRAECPEDQPDDPKDYYGSANDDVILSRNEEIDVACHEYADAAAYDDPDGGEGTILGNTEHNTGNGPGSNIVNQNNVSSNMTSDRLYCAPRYRPEAFPMPTPRPWALGWLADREWLIGLGRLLDLCEGPAADDEGELEAAALDYVFSKTKWPNVMICMVDGTTELVFAVYVDDRRRPYPPTSILRSGLLPRKYCYRLEKYKLLDNDPQWFTCEEGSSYTPWRYGCQEPGPNAGWIDVSRYQPHPDAEYDRIEVEEEDENECEEYYEEDIDSEAGEDGQEFLDDADYVEEGDYVGEGYIAEDDDVAYDEVKPTLVEDDDSVTVHGDMDDVGKFDIIDSEHDDALDAVDDTVSPTQVSGDVSASLSSALDAVAL